MVAILSIGTELTTGQILNKNVQWLSGELLKLGVGVSFQITVPDNAKRIEEALGFLQNKAKVILTTGGLGPTADDFTRKILAAKFQLPLIWDEGNWLKVQAKLNSKKVPIREIHRQQCFYPRGAELLDNAVGVADGFLIESESVQIIALPGPPNEIADIWDSQLRLRLNDLAPKPLRWAQRIWTTSGLPESDVASKVNEALAEDALQVLYRVHSPYVDVKLLFQYKDSKYYEGLGLQIQKTLNQWLVTGEDQ
jgi:molybdenum cofactor synthesis domain-containing protein